MNSVFAILSHAKMCTLILSSIEFSLCLCQLCHNKEFSLLFPLFFFKLYSSGNGKYQFLQSTIVFDIITIVLLFTGISTLRYYLLVFNQSPIVVEVEDWYDACMYVCMCIASMPFVIVMSCMMYVRLNREGGVAPLALGPSAVRVRAKGCIKHQAFYLGNNKE
jgi:hypothetical protein